MDIFYDKPPKSDDDYWENKWKKNIVSIIGLFCITFIVKAIHSLIENNFKDILAAIIFLIVLLPGAIFSIIYVWKFHRKHFKFWENLLILFFVIAFYVIIYVIANNYYKGSVFQ
jgi:hypothetical protein